MTGTTVDVVIIGAGGARLLDLAPFSAARFAAPRPWLHEHRYGAEEDTATISRQPRPRSRAVRRTGQPYSGGG